MADDRGRGGPAERHRDDDPDDDVDLLWHRVPGSGGADAVGQQVGLRVLPVDVPDERQNPLRPGGPTLARTADEALLYLDMEPCHRCGGKDIEWADAAVEVPQGGPGREYSGRCGACGALRRYVFRVPAGAWSSGSGCDFGGDSPSELLDAGDWWRLSDLAAGEAASADPDAAGEAFEVALATVREVLKFVPDSGDRVPEEAFWTARGRAVRDADPSRFERDRLEALRDRYQEELTRRGVPLPPPGHQSPAWDELVASLARVIGELPDGGVLQLYDASLLRLDALADIWHAAGTLYVRPAGQATASGLAWPPDEERCRELAAGLVSRLRAERTVAEPADIACRAWQASTGEPVPQPFPELADLTITYFVRLGAADTEEEPRGLLRRTRAGLRVADHALRPDGRWYPSTTIDDAELGGLTDRLVMTSTANAVRVATAWRTAVASQVRPALPPYRMDGSVSLRWIGLPQLAPGPDGSRLPVVPGDRPLDLFERGEVAGYLSTAPVVVATVGLGPDPLDAAEPEIVPLNIRTDGRFVWSEALAYFASRYGIPPRPPLAAGMREWGYLWPEADEETLRHAARLAHPS